MAMSIPGLTGELKAGFEEIWGVAPDPTRLEQFCNVLATKFINHITANATITLSAADIQVPGLGLLDGQGQAVTGIASNSHATLNGKVS